MNNILKRTPILQIPQVIGKFIAIPALWKLLLNLLKTSGMLNKDHNNEKSITRLEMIQK